MDYSLNNHLMRRLVNDWHANEMRVILQHRYIKPQARTDDISACTQAYQVATELLNKELEESELKKRNKSLWKEMWDVIRSGIRFSYEALGNLSLRAQFTTKFLILLENQSSTIRILQTRMNAIDRNNASGMAGEWKLQLEDPLELFEVYIKNINDLFAKWKNASMSFWPYLMRWKIPSFQQYLRTVKVEEKISPEDKFSVYPLNSQYTQIRNAYLKAEAATEEMIQTNEQVLIRLGNVGRTILLFTLGVMAWTIIDSHNPVLQTAKNTFDLGASLAGGAVGTAAGMALGRAAGSLGATIGGVLGGIICGFAAGVAADSLFDAVFEAFTKPPSQELRERLFDAPIMYELQLPDNISLSSKFTKSLTGKL